jgi:hypothetical protein
MELTTGVMFLMSSMYGAGNGSMQANLAAATIPTNGQATVAENRTFTDNRSVEQYVRKEFADEPILVDIAACESNFHQFDASGNVVHGIVNKADVGVMQINETFHAAEAAKLHLDLNTTEGNVAFAKYLYAKFGTDPWKYSQKCWSNKLAENR